MILAYISLTQMVLLCVNLLVEIELTLRILPRKKSMAASLNRTHHNIYLSSPTGIVADHKMKYTLNRDGEALFVPHILNLGSAIRMLLNIGPESDHRLCFSLAH